jgi:hypothetical protein
MVKKTEFYRLLKPSEVLKIESEIKNSDLRMSFKTAVFTGMRYKELQLFAEHPEWFNHNRKIIGYGIDQTWKVPYISLTILV